MTINDLTIGWQKSNPLSHPNATQAPQARASGENLNDVTLVPQARPSGEILNYSLSRYFDILCMIIDYSQVSRIPVFITFEARTKDYQDKIIKTLHHSSSEYFQSTLMVIVNSLKVLTKF